MSRTEYSALLLAFGALFVVAAGPAGAQSAASGDEAKADTQAIYDDVVDQYMHSNWGEFQTSMKSLVKHSRHLTAEQRSEIGYMRRALKDFRPKWWDNTKSSKNISFDAEIWGKAIKANYMPSEVTGMEFPVDIDERTGRFRTIVTWQPHKVDSTKPLLDRWGDSSSLHQAHQLTEGDLAEAIVWHELGHNYVTQGLPATQVIKLYQDYRLLFSALQEFYADMTALYHCSPQGRKTTMLLRTTELRWNDVNDPHVRAAHGIAAWVLAHVLSDVEKWPSFRLPDKVPQKDVEQTTMLYMYKNIDPGYTLAEDRALRDMVGRFIRTKGADILRKKGAFKLPNGLEFKIMTAEDRANQTKRDAWIKEHLEKAIASGLIKKGGNLRGHPKRFRIKVAW